MPSPTSPGVSPAALAELLSRVPGQRVLVIGDVMLDHFVFGRVNRISPEAPVPVVEFDHEEFRLGGAANVAHNLRALGAEVQLGGVVGDDEAADRVVAEVGALGIDPTRLVRTSDRPTTRKTRIVTLRHQQVARIDYEQDGDVRGVLEDRLIEAVMGALAGAAVVLVSDYLKGVVTSALMTAVVREAARAGVPVLVDPKIPHIDHYRGVALVTPNHHEAEVATALRIRNDEDARAAARAFRAKAGCDSVLITRGEQGMWLLEGRPSAKLHSNVPSGGALPGPGDVLSELSLHSVAREIADVTGAGDTVISTMALAIAAGGSLPQAATLANHAAGISVAKFGPASVSVDELRSALGLALEGATPR